MEFSGIGHENFLECLRQNNIMTGRVCIGDEMYQLVSVGKEKKPQLTDGGVFNNAMDVIKASTSWVVYAG